MHTEALPWDLQRYRAGLRQRYGGSRPGMSTGRAIACPRPWEPERSSEDRLVDGAWTVLDRSRRITRTIEVHIWTRPRCQGFSNGPTRFGTDAVIYPASW